MITATLTTQQTKAISHLNKYKVGALFMEPGTGKTRTCVELVNSAIGIDFILYIAPLRTIKPPKGVSSVIDEVAKWGGFKAPARYVGIESISQSDRIYLETFEELKRYANPFIVVDESISIKNFNAKRTTRVLEMGKHAEYKLIMNGTPATRDLLDYWAQFEFLNHKILNMTLNQFKNSFCKTTTIIKKVGYRSFSKEFITGYANIDYLHELTRRYLYECDLKMALSQHFHRVDYCLSQEHADAYAEIKEYWLSLETLEWKSNNIFYSMTQKMQHAYCCTPDKIRAVKDIMATHAEIDCLIFCKYIASAAYCREQFPNATVMTYQTSAVGLNLQAYSVTIYFDKVWDYYLRRQSLNRTFRTGQVTDCHYYDLDGNTGLDRMIDVNVSKKISMVEYIKTKTKEEIIKEL